MNTRTHLYIVIFSASKQYRYEFDAPADSDSLHNSLAFEELEKQLNQYLKKEFPDEPIAYYTSARVEEISPEHRERWEQYPPLDEEAVANIEKLLAREIRDRLSNEELNSDAPWADIN